MAKLTEIMLTFQKYFNEYGDMQVVYRDANNNIVDILASGLSWADNVNNEKIKVCWLSDYGHGASSDPVSAPTSD